MDINNILFTIGIIVIIILLIIILLRNKGPNIDEQAQLEADKNRERELREMAISFQKLNENIKYLQGELRDTNKSIDEKFREQSRDMRAEQENIRKGIHTQFSESKNIITDITKQLTEVKEGNKQVFTIAEQLQSLEKVLTNQKQRGNWGEASLELILQNVLAGNYETQYRFKDGDIVDAVIKIKDKLLPIDSKFSLDNYERCVNAPNDEEAKIFATEFKKDLKKRIDETSKYIKENENTLPIVFMFIPSEAIYYDLLAGNKSRIKVNTQDLIEYAQDRKVFIVSPNSIYAYLNLVLSGIKAFQIENQAKDIQDKVSNLGKHIEGYQEYLNKLGNSLATTVNHYNSANKEFKKIDKDVYKITGGEVGGEIEILSIDRPDKEE